MPTVVLEVLGRVQGVGFRWYVRESARALGVRGWVRNLESGGVEIAAEGSASDLLALERQVERGPSGASVREVIRHSPRPDFEYPDPFTIRR